MDEEYFDEYLEDVEEVINEDDCWMPIDELEREEYINNVLEPQVNYLNNL